jgi:hypothetical protein
MDVERIIDEIRQLEEIFEAPDIRPLSARDISAANRKHDEMLARVAHGFAYGNNLKLIRYATTQSCGGRRITRNSSSICQSQYDQGAGTARAYKPQQRSRPAYHHLSSENETGLKLNARG